MFLRPVVPVAAPGASETQASLDRQGKAKTVYKGKELYLWHPSAIQKDRYCGEQGMAESKAAAALSPAIPFPPTLAHVEGKVLSLPQRSRKWAGL